MTPVSANEKGWHPPVPTSSNEHFAKQTFEHYPPAQRREGSLGEDALRSG